MSASELGSGDYRSCYYNEDPNEALPIIVDCYGDEFYKVKTKYEPASLHMIPARLFEPAVYARAQELAIKVTMHLVAAAFRGDFIVT